MNAQNGERRSGGDRRADLERRLSPDRRSGIDRRRNLPDKVASRLANGQSFVERRSGRDRRAGLENRRDIERRSGVERRVDLQWYQSGLESQISADTAIDLVSDFYSASMDSRFWPTALAKLREALQARACALVTHDYATGSGMLEQAVGIDIEMVGAYAEYFAQRNPWVQHEESFRQPGAVWTDEQVAVDEEAAAGEFRQGWLSPQDLGRQLFGVLERNGGRVVFLYALRPARAAAFADSEVTLLKQLLPYLQRSLRAGQLLRRTQNVRQAALDALDAMPMGVLLMSTGGAVLGANRTARETMAARDVITVGRGGLEFIVEGRRRRFRDLFDDLSDQRGVNRPRGPIALTLPRPSELRPLSLLICPVPEASRGGPEDPAAVMFIGDPDRAADIDEDRLRQIYGLTAAEARVAALLAQGHRLEEIAELLGVAYETTRKHLKKVLAKMQTDRQAEVVRVIMTGPGGLAR